MTPHAARPLTASGPARGLHPIFVTPLRCAVCDEPIEQRKPAFAFRHIKKQPLSTAEVVAGWHKTIDPGSHQGGHMDPVNTADHEPALAHGSEVTNVFAQPLVMGDTGTGPRERQPELARCEDCTVILAETEYEWFHITDLVGTRYDTRP